MCLRIHPNGAGNAKGTHMSVFFVLMRGDYDDLLPFPFQQEVTITLVDHSTIGGHVTETIQPEPNTRAFDRPTSASGMNSASGCQRFVSLDTLHSRTATGQIFIENDTVTVRVHTLPRWCLSQGPWLAVTLICAAATFVSTFDWFSCLLCLSWRQFQKLCHYFLFIMNIFLEIARFFLTAVYFNDENRSSTRRRNAFDHLIRIF